MGKREREGLDGGARVGARHAEETRALLAGQVFPPARVDQGEARLRHGANDTLRLSVVPIRADSRGAAPTMRRAPSRHELHRSAQAAVRLWNLCRPIHGSHAEAYLRARGLEHCSGLPSLRFHPGLFYRGADDAHQALPALVAAVTDHAGGFTGVQRTYLDRHRPAKASVTDPRKALGAIHGRAVHLGEGPATLAVAQGIETALALRTACPELAVAATLTAASLSAFIPPARVTRLLARCRDRALAAGVIASEGRDFNDDLLAHGPEALSERIRQAPWPGQGH